MGCTTEGAMIKLLGERNFNFMMGTPCTTNKLDLPGTTEYTTAGYEFTEKEALGACYEAALNARLTNGGTVTWEGSGTWTPRKTPGAPGVNPFTGKPMVCADWISPSSFAWTCDMDGPESGGQGTLWTLSNCDINPFFSVSCP